MLAPAGQRTLRGLCEFIAEGALRPAIEPLRILGGSCLPAGAFLAIRSMLREAGADADRVMPSTPLDEFARHYPGVFLGPISRLAPNTLPPVSMSTPEHDLPFVGCMLSVLATFAGSCFFPWRSSPASSSSWPSRWRAALPPGGFRRPGSSSATSGPSGTWRRLLPRVRRPSAHESCRLDPDPAYTAQKRTPLASNSARTFKR